MDIEIIKVVYLIAGFLAVALSSYINWKASSPAQEFNLSKFLSAYLRTAWGLVPLVLFVASGLGLAVEGFLTIFAAAFGIDNGVQAAAKIRSQKSTEDSGTTVSILSSDPSEAPSPTDPLASLPDEEVVQPTVKVDPPQEIVSPSN